MPALEIYGMLVLCMTTSGILVLTPEQLDRPIAPEHWGGHQSLRSWLADGASTEAGMRHAVTAVWPVLMQWDEEKGPQQP